MTFLLLLALSFPIPHARAQAEASSITLRKCYDWALAQSEELKHRGEDIEQSRQRARGALAGVYPRLEFDFNETIQDPSGVRTLESRGFSGFVQKEQSESFFSLSQPIFSGLKEFSSLKGFRAESERDALRLKRARSELYARTAKSFFGVLGLETEAANTEDGLRLALDRVKELEALKRLGKARQSELFTAQAHAAALKAGLSHSRAGIASARAELSFLTGQDLALLPLADEPGAAAAPPLAEMLARARERSDMQALRRQAAADELRVRYELGNYWPSLDLLGRYHTRRATFMKEIAWDALLALRLPLFQGGRVAAAVEGARSMQRQTQFALQELERMAAYQVRRLHGELSSAIEEARAQEESAQAAQRSYDSLRDEYKLGLVTNLDVLQALDLLQAQRAARDAASLRVKGLAVSLGVAAETLP